MTTTKKPKAFRRDRRGRPKSPRFTLCLLAAAVLAISPALAEEITPQITIDQFGWLPRARKGRTSEWPLDDARIGRRLDELHADALRIALAPILENEPLYGGDKAK